jgi:hypothetical protein
MGTKKSAAIFHSYSLKFIIVFKDISILPLEFNVSFLLISIGCLRWLPLDRFSLESLVQMK